MLDYTNTRAYKKQTTASTSTCVTVSREKTNARKMKYTAVLLLLIALSETALAATCTYYRSSSRITCGSVTCTAIAPSRDSEKLPAGYYYIGDYGYRGTWFKLYRQRARGGYWDYHTLIPELGCRGGFALHPGTYSEGCITVTDNNCYRRLKNVITRYPAIWFSVRRCHWCRWGVCFGGTSTTSRLCTTDLQAV